MRKFFILLIISVLSLSSCMNTLEIPFDAGEDMLILNARFESHKTTHIVYLSYKKNGNIIVPDSNSKVYLKVNGGKEEEIPFSDKYGDYGLKYSFEYQFKEGDTIELRAEGNGKKVNAKATFLPAVERVEVSQDDNSTYLSFEDNRTSEDFYRFQVDYTYRVTVTDKITGEVKKYDNRYDSYVICNDPLISDMPKESGLLADLISEIFASNINFIFNDYQLTTSKVNIAFDVMNSENIPGVVDLTNKQVDITERSINVYLQHLSIDDYFYFKSLNAGDSFGFAGNILVEPTIVRTNVEGGSGYVSAITSTKGSLSLPSSFDIYGGLYY